MLRKKTAKVILFTAEQASQYKTPSCIQFGRTPLMFAVLGDYPECVEVLLKFGGDPELKDKSGRTALHWAGHHGNVACLKVILARSAVGWTEPDQGGVTVLHLVTRYPVRKGLQLVLKHFSIGQGEIDVQVSLN